MNNLFVNKNQVLNPLQVVESAFPGIPKLSMGLPLHMTGILELAGLEPLKPPVVAPKTVVMGGGYRSISKP